MSFFSKMISKRPESETTIAAIRAAIANVKTDHQRASGTLATIEKSLLTPEDFESPEALDDARRNAERLRGEVEFWAGRVTKLEADLVEAEKRDQDAALEAWAAGVRKESKGYGKVIGEYERTVSPVASLLTRAADIKRNVYAYNREAPKHGWPLIELQGVHYGEPDVEISPEQPIFEERWVEPDGQWSVNQGVAGPRHHKARLEKVQVGVTTADIRPGRSIPAPEDVARLPAARLGQADFYRGPKS